MDKISYRRAWFDRVIRFNNLVFPRRYVKEVGVSITKVIINGQNVIDSLIGQKINLGPNTHFVGTPNLGGREVLLNFEVSIGSNHHQIYLCGQTSKIPFNTKYEKKDNELAKIKTGIKSEDMSNFVNQRMQLLNSNSENNVIDRQRLDNIENSLWIHTPWNQAPLLALMNFRFPIDKKIKINELDSKVINIIKNNNNDMLHNITNWYLIQIFMVMMVMD